MIDKNERFEMRVDSDMLNRLDTWRERQHDSPTRAEAARRLIDKGIRSELSNGEKLITYMLCEMIDALEIKTEFNTDFLKSLILGGHFWALKWEMQGIFHDHSDDPAKVSTVGDVLDMWLFIEEAYANLSDKDKIKIEKEAEPFGKYVQFYGFDGNYEADYISIARFLVEKMNRFTHFKNREFNSHVPTVERYSRMHTKFEKMRPNLGFGKELDANSIIEILNAAKC